MTLMGCAKRPPPVDFEKDFLQEKTKYEPNIGKDYWLTRLRPDGIERGITSEAYYHVTLDDNRTGYISAFQLVAFATNTDPAQAAAECRRRGDPRLGMTCTERAASFFCTMAS